MAYVRLISHELDDDGVEIPCKTCQSLIGYCRDNGLIAPNLSDEEAAKVFLEAEWDGACDWDWRSSVPQPIRDCWASLSNDAKCSVFLMASDIAADRRWR